MKAFVKYAVEEFKKDFDNGKLILCDPGKRSLLYLMASNKIIHRPDKKIKNRFNLK